MKHGFKKKTIVIICLVALVVFTPVYMVFVSLNGSLLRKIAMKNKAKAYVAKEFPGQEWEISAAGYDFKCGNYYCPVQSPTSRDTFFNVYETRDKILQDDYDVRVTNKDNTIWRIAKQLESAVDEKVLPTYPHRSRLMMADFYMNEEFDPSKFELDMEVDLAALPHPATFTFWVETACEEPTWEEAAELLREAARLTEEAGLDFDYYSIAVEYPYEEVEGELIPTNFDSIVGASDVPREVIVGVGLEELLEEEKKKREEELQDWEKEQIVE